jgi:hypothetical protein
MNINSDPRNGGGNDGNEDVNDFPDIPTNDRGQASEYPISPNDYPDFNTNDWAQKSQFPDIGAGED